MYCKHQEKAFIYLSYQGTGSRKEQEGAMIPPAVFSGIYPD